MTGTIKRDSLLTVLVAVLFVLVPVVGAADQSAAKPGAEFHTIYSEFTQQDYRLWIYLPADYQPDQGQTYPVVYGVDYNSETAALTNFLYGALNNNPAIPDFILVGIGFESDIEHWGLRSAQFTPSNNPSFDQTNIDGIKDSLQDALTVTENDESRWRSGQASSFTQVLIQEIMPFIEERYSVGGSNTLLGHSFGGLYISHLLLTAPQTFDNYWLSSPSLWWHERLMLTAEADYAGNHGDLPAKVFMSVGALESEDMLGAFQLFADNLQQRGYPNLHFQSVVVADTNHSSVILPAFNLAMRFFFGGPSQPHQDID